MVFTMPEFIIGHKDPGHQSPIKCNGNIWNIDEWGQPHVKFYQPTPDKPEAKGIFKEKWRDTAPQVNNWDNLIIFLFTAH